MGNNVKQKSFRSSIGGFNKKDVVEFITDENRKFSEEKARLSEEIESKERIVSELEAKVTSLFNENGMLRDEMLKTGEKLTSVVHSAEEYKQYAEKTISDLTASYSQLTSHTAEIEKERDNALSEVEKSNTENAHLKQAAGENAKTLAKYLKHIEELEAASDSSKECSANVNELRGENEALRAIIAQLQENFNSASGYITQLEERLEELNSIYAQRDASNVSNVTEKAIDSIIAINDDVKDYMGSCVDEFDKYSQDITSGIAKLLEDMSDRCRKLETKIAESKNAAMKNIDLRFFDN